MPETGSSSLTNAERPHLAAALLSAGSALLTGFRREGLLGGVAAVLAVGFAAILFAAKQGIGTGILPSEVRSGFSRRKLRQSA